MVLEDKGSYRAKLYSLIGLTVWILKIRVTPAERDPARSVDLSWTISFLEKLCSCLAGAPPPVADIWVGRLLEMVDLRSFFSFFPFFLLSFFLSTAARLYSSNGGGGKRGATVWRWPLWLTLAYGMIIINNCLFIIIVMLVKGEFSNLLLSDERLGIYTAMQYPV